MPFHTPVYYWAMPVACAFSSWGFVCLLIYFFRKKQKSLKDALAKEFSKLLLSNKEVIKNSIASQDNVEKIIPELDKHIHEFIAVKVPKEMPMIAMFIGEKTTHQIKEIFMKELSALFPVVLSQYFDKVFSEEKLRKIAEQQLSGSSETSIAQALQQKYKPLLLKIKAIAFIFGLVLGVIFILAIHLLT
ncbi:hypothetical protein A9P82_09275 [Arachidicoccus ginsenosidimutans]|uniref:hypothetical protein n=1 Tax=Arachidicoccus sp. BS20 TaxID=1850526 RepID=UPI0007F0CE2C|nr:hypothetical protein [Arachidicoccus sp. BS20]ANI89466.1 hypothetical protein A9P82_09275 [Arachidicoccus sp. BS20]